MRRLEVLRAKVKTVMERNVVTGNRKVCRCVYIYMWWWVRMV